MILNSGGEKKRLVAAINARLASATSRSGLGIGSRVVTYNANAGESPWAFVFGITSFISFGGVVVFCRD